MTEHWNALFFCKSEFNTKNILQKIGFTNLPNETIDDRARAISTHVCQAEEFFTAARNVSLYTKPDILYYAMLNLLKAFLLLKFHNCEVAINPQDAKQNPGKLNFCYHGLAFIFRDNPLSNSSAKVSGGVFWEYLKRRCIDPSIQSYNVYGNNQILPEFTLEQSLSVIPEIYFDFSMSFNQPPKSLPAILTKSGQAIDSIEFEIDKRIGISMNLLFDNIISSGTSLFSGSKTSEFENQATWVFKPKPSYISPQGIYTTLPNTFEYEYIIPPWTHNYLIGALDWNVSSGTTKICFTPDITMYITMFILSSLSRYKPVSIRDVIEGKSSGLSTLVDKFIQTTLSRFPAMLSEQLII